MTELFIGWDVGAWHCDEGKSRDAVCVLKGRFPDLRLAAAPRRGNLRKAITGQPTSPADLLAGVKNLEVPDGPKTVCIDATLGWPAAFRQLVVGGIPTDVVGDRSDDDPYLFRRTERKLMERGFRPLSPVQDMIGSQSTKALHFLHRAGFQRKHPGVWVTGPWTCIEVYPTTCRRSATLRPIFQRLRQEPLFDERIRCGENVRTDCEDALWCALTAALWASQPESTVPPPDDAEGTVRGEGWIWIPTDALPEESEGEVEQ